MTKRGRPKSKEGPKVYMSILVEKQVAIMFNLYAKSLGKVKTPFLVELMELYRKNAK
jgi:hypothetical protein